MSDSGLTHQLHRWSERIIRPLGLVALVSLILEYGFHEPLFPRAVLISVQWAAVGVFVAIRLLELFDAEHRREILREHWLDYFLLGIAIVAVLVQIEVGRAPILKAGAIYVGTMQVFLLVRLLFKFFEVQLISSKQRIRPGRAMITSFATIIIVGAALLALPRATTFSPGEGVYYARHLLDCLFTATSATCVTGLVVYDTGRDFTLFGQLVILALIQIGGLGTMIFGSVFGLLAGRQLTLRHSLVLQDALSHDTISEIEHLVRFIFGGTIVIELIGSLLLMGAWGPEAGDGLRRWYFSLFHAVAAFCNAGFGLHSGSLVPYRGAWQIYCVLMPLIVLGGLGFPVLREICSHARGAALGRLTSRLRVFPASADTSSTRAPRWSLQSKIVLVSSGGLIAFGAVCFYAFETPSTMQQRYRQPPGGELRVVHVPDALDSLPPAERALSALFLSVTARTAGFNTVRMDSEALSPTTQFLLCILMFIGGSPASTAGGVKTVTLSILLLTVLATLRRREQIEAFGRSLHWPLIRTASALVTLYALLISGATLVLSFTEVFELRDVLFEICSATGTVGLSTGVTPHLTDVGRAVIILCMFAGRLGPLTLLVALASHTTPARYEYPPERLIIG